MPLLRDELALARLICAAISSPAKEHPFMNIPALGIDIAKLKFNVCLINSDGKLRPRSSPTLKLAVNNSHSGIAKQQVERVYACLEATGTYGERLAFFLHEDGHTVSVINPAAVSLCRCATITHQD
jgi:hypothetical protein